MDFLKFIFELYLQKFMFTEESCCVPANWHVRGNFFPGRQYGVLFVRRHIFLRVYSGLKKNRGWHAVLKEEMLFSGCALIVIKRDHIGAFRYYCNFSVSSLVDGGLDVIRQVQDPGYTCYLPLFMGKTVAEKMDGSDTHGF